MSSETRRWIPAAAVGRVGGLAVALGIGAAALHAAAVAWADTGSPDPAAASSAATSAVRPGPAAANHAGRAGKAIGGGTGPGSPSSSRTASRAALQPRVSPAAVRRPSPASAAPEASTPAARRGSPAPSASAVADPTFSIGACSQASASCTYVMGPSGFPIPTDAYADTAMKFYVLPNTTQADTTTQSVYTPEGAYPATGIKVLPLTISVEQGKTILTNTMKTLQPGPIPGDLPITVFGYSQSAVITSLLQRDLDNEIGLLPGVDRSRLSFVTVGNEMNPNGGWFARFPGLNTPSLGEYFFGSTPENSYTTTNYTLEYDGFADSPRYPLNFLSALNAAMGILLVHGGYTNEKYFQTTYGTTPGSFDPVMGTLGPGEACNQGSTSCTALPSTSPSQKYYFIQTPNLPLLAPVRAIPFIGKPIAALIQPVLKVIVNLGYGDKAHGFTTATQPMANEPLPFGLFPRVSPQEVVQQLVAGVKQGVVDFVASLKAGGSAPGIALPTLKQLLGLAKEVITTLPARISAGASALYASLLATADFINAAVVSLPAYNVALFGEGIEQALSGQFIEGIVNAVGRPIAADVGMAATIGVIQATVWLEAVIAALTGCGPAAPQAGMCLTLPPK